MVWRSCLVIWALAGQLHAHVVNAATFGTVKDFVDRHHCQVTSQLQILHEKRGQPNRYLMVSFAYAGDQYTQCLFEDDNSELLCEAASGFYTSKDGAPRTFTPSDEQRAELSVRGFSTDDSKGNFVKILKLQSYDDLPMVAHMLLSTLARVYGANLTSEIEVVAPLAPLSIDAQSKCTPLS